LGTGFNAGSLGCCAHKSAAEVDAETTAADAAADGDTGWTPKLGVRQQRATGPQLGQDGKNGVQERW